MNQVFDASFWNRRYTATHGYVYGTAPNEFLAATAERIPPGPVLCLAEGEGRNGVFLAGRGHAVTAVDQSAAGLAKAHTLAESQGVSLATIVADLEQYPIAPCAWAGVTAIFMHLPPGLRARVLQRAVDGLRPGGVFVLECNPRPSSPSTPVARATSRCCRPSPNCAANLPGSISCTGRNWNATYSKVTATPVGAP